MSSAHETFAAYLKEAGYSVTQARLAVFQALTGQEPLTMHQLVERVPGVDRASVYRAIGLFETLGVIQRLNTGWKYKIELSDKFTEHHHHLTCTECGRTTILNEDELELFIERLARKHAFRPSAHQIEIQGICERCAKPAAMHP